MNTITAKDLTKEYPRSPLAEINGYPWLARLIDKVQAKHAGTLGGYTPYPCGGDRGFLAAVGVDADALEAVITGGASDAEIGAWVQDHQAPGTADNILGYSQAMLAPAPAAYAEYLSGAIAEVQAERPELDLSGADGFTKLICIEEGHAFA